MCMKESKAVTVMVGAGESGGPGGWTASASEAREKEKD